MCVCVFVTVLMPLTPWQSRPHDRGGVIVLNSAPSFHSEKEDFLSQHSKRGKRECVSAPVFLFLRIPSCYCTNFTECIRFTVTARPNTDPCQVTWPTSINLKIYSWLSKLSSSSCVYFLCKLSQVMGMCWHECEGQDWLVNHKGLDEVELISQW